MSNDNKVESKVSYDKNIKTQIVKENIEKTSFSETSSNKGKN